MSIPPKFARRFLHWFCRKEHLEELEGNLIEIYEKDHTDNENRAKWKFIWNVLLHFRPDYIRPINGISRIMDYAMLKNHLKIAIRSNWRYRGYSFINVFGLISGLSVFLIIMLYVYNEWSFDQFHQDAERIYRIEHDQIDQNYGRRITASPGLLGAALVDDIPEVEEMTRVLHSGWGKALLSNDNYKYYDQNFLYSDQEFFEIFSYEFIKGNRQKALSNPSAIILTEKLAHQFFGESNPLGQILIFNQNIPLEVSGIIKDIPQESHLIFDFIIPITIANRPGWEQWGESHFETYIKVNSTTDIGLLNSKIQSLVDNHQQDYWGEKSFRESYFTQPLAGVDGIHLSEPGIKLYLQVLTLVACFILLIAGINYINLATARSVIRSREIGVRKVIGSRRYTIMVQFVMESILMVFISGCLSLILAEIVLRNFKLFMDSDLSLLAMNNILVWCCIAVIFLLFGFLAGIYPAFYLSSFKPIAIFKGKKTSNRSAFQLRQFLVVAQFALSIFLLVGMFVVHQQVDFLRTADLGFDKEHVIVINNFHKGPQWGDPNFVMRNAIEDIPGVVRVGGSIENILGMRGAATGKMQLDATSPPIPCLAQLVDVAYFEALGLELIEGRLFSAEFADDLSFKNVIVNETAVRKLGLKGSAVGQQFGPNGEETIIGVVKDFQASNLHYERLPYIFKYSPQALFSVVVKLLGADIQNTLGQIEETWASAVPDYPLDYYFLDEAIDRQYRAEKQFNLLFSIMTGLAVVIACLGLFGLAAFTAEQRKREISIRKVLGASVKSVVSMLSLEFLKLVFIANIIAWPLAWFVMRRWLNNFAYQIDIGIIIFIVAGSIALAIAMITVSAQAFKAATANPVESLRNE